jgi:glycerophosphoryl diester phosphodiesterase
LASSQQPWCIAHRGARNEAPENTRSAFLRALSYPIDGIELDLQMTSDGVPVVFHDRTLQRVGAGRRRIADLPLDHLRQLDWGGWFHPDFAGEPLMTLDCLLTMLDRCPRWLIEIKSRPGERSNGHARRLAERVVSMISQPPYNAFQDRLYILSFDAGVLSTVHQLAPNLRMVRNLKRHQSLEGVDGIRRLWAIDVPIENLSPSVVQWARDRSMRVMCYTCNGPRQVDKATRLGVDAIISDHPGWLTRYLAR